MMASSAARWSVSRSSRLVSSKRRAFSSEALRLAAIVVSSRTSPSSKAYSRSRFCSDTTPATLSSTRRGTNTSERDGSPLMATGLPYRSAGGVRIVVDEQRLAGLEDVPAEPHERDRLVGEADPAFDGVGEVELLVGRVVEAHVDDLGVEQLADLLPHQLDHRLHLELLGEALLDAVDDGQLRRALAGLVDQADVLQGDAEAGRDRRQELHVGLGEGVLVVQVLERDDAARPAADAAAARTGRPWPVRRSARPAGRAPAPRPSRPG